MPVIIAIHLTSVRFLAQVTMESAANEMTVENISRVFAPSLFPEKPIDAANPMLAFAEVQLQKVILAHLITKYIREEDSMMMANVKLSSKMMSRLNRSAVEEEEEEEEEEVMNDDGTN
jgi:hypothetical protein